MLPRIASWLRLGGVMVSILQLPAKHLKKVSETSYTSLNILNSIMKLISPQEFKSTAYDAGLQEIDTKTVILESGKSFYIGTYEGF